MEPIVVYALSQMSGLENGLTVVAPDGDMVVDTDGNVDVKRIRQEEMTARLEIPMERQGIKR